MHIPLPFGFPNSASRRSGGAALLLAGALMVAPAARAQLVAYEGFNYAAGSDLAGAAGGFGWSGGWIGSAPYSFQTEEVASLSAGNATHGYLAATGGAAIFGPTGSVSGLSFRRNLATPLGDTSGTWFISFLMDFDSTAEMLMDINTSTGGWGFSLGSLYPYLDRFAIQRYQSGANLGTVNQQTNLFVVKLELGGGASANTSRISVYINPALDNPAPSPAGVLDNQSLFSVGSVGLTSRGGVIHLDEIRIGATLASVLPVATAVPEPAGAAKLGGIGALFFALAAGRRRSRSENLDSSVPCVP